MPKLAMDKAKAMVDKGAYIQHSSERPIHETFGRFRGTHASQTKKYEPIRLFQSTFDALIIYQMWIARLMW
jgi:hypothetical protein